jgi:hypothetical protein
VTHKFVLNPDEIVYSGSAMSDGRKKVRYSRANQVSSREIILTHKPTGIQVKGAIRSGNYSRTEMKRLTSELYQQLYKSLEDSVAKALRISGR